MSREIRNETNVQPWNSCCCCWWLAPNWKVKLADARLILPAMPQKHQQGTGAPSPEVVVHAFSALAGITLTSLGPWVRARQGILPNFWTKYAFNCTSSDNGKVNSSSPQHVFCLLACNLADLLGVASSLPFTLFFALDCFDFLGALWIGFVSPPRVFALLRVSAFILKINLHGQ